jgi:hypothetical protein
MFKVKVVEYGYGYHFISYIHNLTREMAESLAARMANGYTYTYILSE